MEGVQEHNYMINDLKEKREQFYPDAVISFERKEEEFVFFCKNELVLRLYVLSDSIIRFRYAVDGVFPDDFSYAIDNNQFKGNLAQLAFEEQENLFLLKTKALVCEIRKENLAIRILNHDGLVISEDEKGFHWEDNRNDGGEIVMMSKKVQGGEHYYGLGDKSCSLELRGKSFQLWGSDTYGYEEKSDPLYKNIPFYIGVHHSHAYGIFFDNSFRSFFDFGHERSNVSSFFAHGGEMDYYFIYGPEMLKVVGEYQALTGVPEMPPLWALGYHQCKWSYYPESVVKDITQEFRNRQIPCDAIYLDIDYMDGFRCFTWNKELFPDPKRMVKELRDNGFKTVTIIDPGIKIDKDYWVYQQGIENGYFCRRGDGPLMKGSVWPGLCNFPDFTSPDVREWWAGLFREMIEEIGVRGVWNDMNEPAVFEEGTFPNDVRHDYDGHPCSHRKGHNVYGMQMARATFEGVKRFLPDERPFVITRSGYAGVQRYSSAWTGDNMATWEHLTIANVQCQRLNISGLSFVGSDIGGFIETPSAELYTRWVQLGVFHPFCRTHSSGDHGEQEPWSFGEESTVIVKKFIELRYKLLPYIYTTFYQNVKYKLPMLRPLVFVDQNDPETYYRQEEFALGDHLLICPVSQENVEGRWLYLPSGNWYYFWTDELVNGGMEVWAEADINRIPLYVKAGSIVPNYPVQQYVGEKKIEKLTLHVYYTSEQLNSMLYEDAGNGYGYKEGECCEKIFKVDGSKEKKLIIEQFMEGDFTPEYAAYELVLHGVPEKVVSVKVDGQKGDLSSVSNTFNRIVIEF